MASRTYIAVVTYYDFGRISLFSSGSGGEKLASCRYMAVISNADVFLTTHRYLPRFYDGIPTKMFEIDRMITRISHPPNLRYIFHDSGKHMEAPSYDENYLPHYD